MSYQKILRKKRWELARGPGTIMVSETPGRRNIGFCIRKFEMGRLMGGGVGWCLNGSVGWRRRSTGWSRDPWGQGLQKGIWALPLAGDQRGSHRRMMLL